VSQDSPSEPRSRPQTCSRRSRHCSGRTFAGDRPGSGRGSPWRFLALTLLQSVGCEGEPRLPGGSPGSRRPTLRLDHSNLVIIHGAATGKDRAFTEVCGDLGGDQEAHPARWEELDHPEAVIRYDTRNRPYYAKADPIRRRPGRSRALTGIFASIRPSGSWPRSWRRPSPEPVHRRGFTPRHCTPFIMENQDEAAAFCQAVKKKLGAPRLTRPFILTALIGVRKGRKRQSGQASTSPV
jgi:hypothetical protein